tara:strand:- start:1435 stop:2577 length:1143 start_codon:yes stop_codon:yes gene_type:complete
MQMFTEDGEGWFESNLGYSASDFVRKLRKARRHNKEAKVEIDDIISDIRTLKSLEVNQTIKGLEWGDEYYETIMKLGVDDRNLKSLRKFGDTRKSSLIRACVMWCDAEDTIKMLESVEDVWDDEQKKSWVEAMESKREARNLWKSSLHHTDRLTKHEFNALHGSSELLSALGPMSGREIYTNLLDKKVLHKSMTPAKLSKMISIYGEEMNIIGGNKRGTFVKMDVSGLILKDPHAYAAGFLDADGYISITKRGEPRAGFIATGTRGKIHCEQLQKTLGCGVLQLDQKIYKDSQRSQHRLQFYSKGDIRKLLNKIMPHLQMKKTQAKAVLAFIDENDSMRKEELKKLVKYENWKDVEEKSDSLLDEWGVTKDDIGKWQEGL